LSKWKSQYPFDVAAIFKQRLEQAGLTEPQLLEMLSEPPEAPTIALGEPPDWAVELLGALAESPNPGLSLGVHQRPVEPQARFLELVRPLIGSAIRRLRECCRSTPSPEGIVALDLDIERMLVGLIPDSLLPVLLRTMALELNVGRLEGRVPRNASKALSPESNSLKSGWSCCASIRCWDA
jgi:hypothetical protein